MASIEDERNAAQEAETIIRSLKPSTRYAKIIIDKLRKAHRLATEARRKKFSTPTTLNAIRDDVGLKLPPFCAALKNGSATREMIEAAKRVVESWLKALAEP
jgi:hypothetical protein